MPEMDDRLGELKAKLQETETEISTKSKDRDNLKADINELQKILGEVTQIVDAYNKVYNDFDKDKKGLEEYAAKKKNMIDAALTDAQKKTVTDAIKSVDDIIDGINKDYIGKGGTYDTAKTAFESAKKDLDIKQKNYDSLKAYQKGIDDSLKNLKSLRVVIEKEEEKNHYLNVYYWSKELNSKVNFTLKKGEDLQSDLKQAWKDLDAAKQTFRTNDEAMTTAKSALDTAKKNLDSKIQSRDADILKLINDQGNA